MMAEFSTDLSKKMLAIADAQKLPAHHEMRVRAKAFDEATSGFYATPQTVKVGTMMAAWARARTTYCKFTGEDLV
jgi:uncharacterized iron-regulated protein